MNVQDDSVMGTNIINHSLQYFLLVLTFKMRFGALRSLFSLVLLNLFKNDYVQEYSTSNHFLPLTVPTIDQHSKLNVCNGVSLY